MSMKVRKQLGLRYILAPITALVPLEAGETGASRKRELGQKSKEYRHIRGSYRRRGAWRSPRRNDHPVEINPGGVGERD